MRRATVALLLLALVLAPTTGWAQALTDIIVNTNSTGDNTLVAAVPSRSIHIYRMMIVVSAATVLTFKDGAGTNLTGPMTMTAGGSVVLDYDQGPLAWFATSSGNAFVVNQTGTAQISGRVGYVLR